jgi:transcriptional regulator with XRE-family HTH domain
MPDEKELEKKIKVLEQQLAEKERIIKDPSKRGYYALSKILYQQIDYLERFDLKKEIEADPKQDKIYDRSKGIWEGLKTMIMDCRTLRQELKISPDEEEKEMKRVYRTTPESMADAIGNVAGQIQ